MQTQRPGPISPHTHHLVQELKNGFLSRDIYILKVLLYPIFLMHNGEIKVTPSAFPIGDASLSVSSENKFQI